MVKMEMLDDFEYLPFMIYVYSSITIKMHDIKAPTERSSVIIVTHFECYAKVCILSLIAILAFDFIRSCTYSFFVLFVSTIVKIESQLVKIIQ